MFRVMVEVEFSDDFLRYLADQIAGNWPEACCSLDCTKWQYNVPQFEFYDPETNKSYTVGQKEMLKGIKLLLVDSQLRPPIPTSNKPLLSPENCGAAVRQQWEDWLCMCDADQADALAQLCCFGEIVYG